MGIGQAFLSRKGYLGTQLLASSQILQRFYDRRSLEYRRLLREVSAHTTRNHKKLSLGLRATQCRNGTSLRSPGTQNYFRPELCIQPGSRSFEPIKTALATGGGLQTIVVAADMGSCSSPAHKPSPPAPLCTLVHRWPPRKLWIVDDERLVLWSLAQNARSGATSHRGRLRTARAQTGATRVA